MACVTDLADTTQCGAWAARSFISGHLAYAIALRGALDSAETIYRRAVDIRMESWLAADTIRRMGFGHIIAAHQHTLIVERGVSFAAFDSSGRAIRTAYASNIFAPQARYLIRTRQ